MAQDGLPLEFVQANCSHQSNSDSLTANTFQKREEVMALAVIGVRVPVFDVIGKLEPRPSELRGGGRNHCRAWFRFSGGDPATCRNCPEEL